VSQGVEVEVQAVTVMVVVSNLRELNGPHRVHRAAPADVDVDVDAPVVGVDGVTVVVHEQFVGQFPFLGVAAECVVVVVVVGVIDVAFGLLVVLPMHDSMSRYDVAAVVVIAQEAWEWECAVAPLCDQIGRMISSMRR